MMIQADGEIYFIDRDNSVFQVNGLTFPHPRDISRTIGDTLLDGVSGRCRIYKPRDYFTDAHRDFFPGDGDRYTER